MGDMLSQAEIDALLNGTSVDDEPTPASTSSSSSISGILSSQEIDALGEIGNISMGTSATTLYTLLGHKVMITTPKVIVTSWDELSKDYSSPYVAVRIEYTAGLIGSNLLVMKEDDVKIITDLMMGGEGTNTSGELTDLHLSAISEAMNQMVGSSSTSMSSMFSKRIDISPPKAFALNFDSNETYGSEFNPDDPIVKISFKMEVGELLDSEIMQIIPLSFAKKLVENLLNIDVQPSATNTAPTPTAAPPQQEMPQQYSQPSAPQGYSQPQMGNPYGMPPQDGMNQGFGQPAYGQQPYPQQGYPQQPYPMQGGFPPGYDQQMFGWQGQPQGYGMDPRQRGGAVNVQPAQFENFDDGSIAYEKKNISLIMDVPLQVTVELGRTQKKIKDILEMGAGSIIELDKLAGEPVDILVNGKPVAKGEVVVIDESFGVRITDIIHPAKRL